MVHTRPDEIDRARPPSGNRPPRGSRDPLRLAEGGALPTKAISTARATPLGRSIFARSSLLWVSDLAWPFEPT